MTITTTARRVVPLTLATAAALLTLILAGAAPPAGAAPLGATGHGTAPASAGARPHGTGPAITRSALTVVDLTTGTATTAVSNSVALRSGCGNSPTFFCLALGTTDSFSPSLSAPMQAGQNLTDPILTVHVGDAVCGEFQTSDPNLGPDYTSSIQVDQFASDLSTMALQFDCTNALYDIYGTIALNVTNTTPHGGYYLFDTAGDTFGFGNDSYLTYLGNPGQLTLNAPVVGMATTPSGDGYWMTAADGGVFAYGDAGFHGSTGDIHLNRPIVGMASTPDGKGYWFVAADGGVFAYGDARFFGSMGATHLNRPIVGMAPTPDGQGYWLVAADGGIFAFGDATFFGSTGGTHLNQPIVGMSSTTDGKGYWFVASDGGVFSFGDATFHGSAGATPLNEPITGMLSTNTDGGYLLVASDGGVFTYGDAPFYGSLGGQGVTGVAGSAA